MNLYLLTNGCGKYYVVAKDPTSAVNALAQLLNTAKYGFKHNRVVQKIELMAMEPVSAVKEILNLLENPEQTNDSAQLRCPLSLGTGVLVVTKEEA